MPTLFGTLPDDENNQNKIAEGVQKVIQNPTDHSLNIFKSRGFFSILST